MIVGQTEKVRADFKAGIRCGVCGSWHAPDVIHLDYVGHAALTDRLLDADPAWFWDPLATTEIGLPAFDQSGGLWIKLTVLGTSRLGYGHAASKPNADPGSREKEVIGDALRNAAMRFGAALDLWHKGDLHVDDGEGDDMPEHEMARVIGLVEATNSNVAALLKHLSISLPNNDLSKLSKEQYPHVVEALSAKLAKLAKSETNAVAAVAAKVSFAEELGDDIPY